MDSSLNRREFLGSLAAAGSLAAVPGAAASGPPPQPWRGVFIIMQTPYFENLKIDGESLKRETEFLVRCGVHGMVWPSGAGETKSISHDERVEFSRVIVKQARHRIPVLVGVHAPNKYEAAEYARQAEAMGADGMLARCQTDGTTDLNILTEYFTAITEASKLPLCIQVTTPATTVDYLIDLAHKLPTFRYVKEEVNPVHRVSEYVKRASGLLVPMTGGGAKMFMNEMARGSGGTMPGAGFADIQAQIWDWFQAGKRKQARELFAKMLMMAVMEEEVTYVLQKEILRRRGVFKTVYMRNTSKFKMDAGDQRELDAVYAALRPYFRV